MTDDEKQPRRVVAAAPDDVAAKWAAQRDELLDRIDTEELVPEWCWTRLTGVLARMDELPPALGWVAVRFLQDVINRGAEVFNRDRSGDQGRLFGGKDRRSLLCTCGAAADDVELLTATRGRRYELATCPDGHEVVRWERSADDVPV